LGSGTDDATYRFVARTRLTGRFTNRISEDREIFKR
jgi:hypothetical protein